MNRNGMIITSLLYAILVLFILILFSVVMTISIRKTLVDGVSKKIESDFISNKLDKVKPVITGQNLLPVFTGQTFVAADYKNGLTATDVQDGDLTAFINCTMPVATIQCTVTDSDGEVSDIFYRNTIAVTQLTAQSTGTYQTFVAPNAGVYRIQLWGAQGGSNPYSIGGKGAYTAGNITLTDGQKLYIYVGSSPNGIVAGYNGGANSANITNSRAGGGATDVRVTPGLWNDTQSLRSRIMVAAGGGGASTYNTTTLFAIGGYGGALTGGPGIVTGSGTFTVPGGGTQTTGGTGGVGTYGTAPTGTFGGGGANLTAGGSGGGGYYGGGGGTECVSCSISGAGGSSFISGYAGCNAVNASGVHTGTVNHYSGLIFNTMTMSAGNVSIPTQDGVTTQTGNSYSGYAKITWISN